MKRTSQLLFALPLSMAMMGMLGCDASSSYGDREGDADTSNPPAANVETDSPGWVTNVTVSKADITVGGMTWGACEAAVRSSITGLDGVEDVLIDRATGQVIAKLADGAELTQEQVAEALAHDERFEVTEFTLQPAASDDDDADADNPADAGEAEPETYAVVMQVPGMTWGGCAAAVRREVGSLEGVLSVNPDLTSREVEVVVSQGTQITEEQLAAAITEAGFELTGAAFPE